MKIERKLLKKCSAIVNTTKVKMTKEISYKGKKYTIEIKIGFENYNFRIIELGGTFHKLPFDFLGDIEKIKPLIIAAIEYKPELYVIQEWDGKL